MRVVIVEASDTVKRQGVPSFMRVLIKERGVHDQGSEGQAQLRRDRFDVDLLAWVSEDSPVDTRPRARPT